MSTELLNQSPIKEKISIVLPTRERPNNIQRLWTSIIETAANKDLVEICLYIDDDDDMSKNRIDHMIEEDKKIFPGGQRIKYMQGERITMSKMWNEAYENLSTGTIIMACGDDIIFRTSNWDNKVRKAFNAHEDKMCLVFGNDLINCEKLATHSFLHKRWIDVSGFFLPPYFASDYCDTWLDYVGKRINRYIYLHDVVTEHMHYVVGKAVKDNNTLERLERHAKEKPELIYKEKEQERIDHANKILEYIKNFPEIKKDPNFGSYHKKKIVPKTSATTHNKISIILPTRNRPQNVNRIIKSINDTAETKELIELCIYIDDDDVFTKHVLEDRIAEDKVLMNNQNSSRIKYMVGPRINLSAMWNTAYDKLATGDIIMPCGDDIVFKTQKWDTVVREKINACADKLICIFGNDTINHHRFASHPFIHRKWIELTGYFMSPDFVGDYSGSWIDNVARKINRIHYVPEIVTEHMHWSVGKSMRDDTTQGRITRHSQPNVEAFWESKEEDRKALAATLIKYIDNFQKTKDAANLKESEEKILNSNKSPTKSDAEPITTTPWTPIKIEENSVLMDRNEGLTKAPNQVSNINIGVIGDITIGYPVALALESKGFNIKFYDIENKITEKTTIQEISCSEDTNNLISKSAMSFTTSYSDLIDHGDIIFTAFPTTHSYDAQIRLTNDKNEYDNTKLFDILCQIEKRLHYNNKNKTLVITMDLIPGTVTSAIKSLELKNTLICYNPLLINETTVINNFLNPKIVLLSNENSGVIESVYRSFTSVPIRKVSFETAELCKLLIDSSGTYKSVNKKTIESICSKIQNVNMNSVFEILMLYEKCKPTTLNENVLEGDRNICLRNYVMSYLCDKLNISDDYFRTTLNTREKVVERLAILAIENASKTSLPIIILGKSFKKNSKVISGSVSYLLKHIIEEKGYEVNIYDPLIDTEFKFIPGIYVMAVKHDVMNNYMASIQEVGGQVINV